MHRSEVLVGRVRTMLGEDDAAEAIAWRGSRIVAVGTRDEVLRLAGPDASVRTTDGCVIPAFIDPHVHLDTTQEARPYDGATSDAELLALLGSAAAGLASGAWLRAEGSLDGRLPTREQLDVVFPDRPVFVSSGFTGVANSRALVEAGITATTSAPPGGYVERTARGEPTGVLGDLAIRLIDAHVPPPRDDMSTRLLRGSRRLSSAGVATVHQIVNFPSVVRALQDLRRTDELPVRFGLLVKAYGHETDMSSLLNLGLETGFGDDWIRIQGTKFLFDGGYPDGAVRYDSDLEHGPSVFRTPPATLATMVEAAHVGGVRCAVHTNGARALDMALDLFEDILARHPRPDHRHRLEHVGNVACSPERIERIASLGLVAVPNPPILFRKWNALTGIDAVPGSMPVNVRDFLDAGAAVGVGSDYPDIYPGEPLTNIHELVTREFSGHSGARDGRLSRFEALSLYTRRAAWLGFEETFKGALAPGYLADIAVLSEDPLADVHLRDDVAVISTIVDGVERHGPDLTSTA
jgi:predicted amidohydrolase YtcJ